MILITDGVNNEGPDPVSVANKLKAFGIEIYCVGVGSGVNKQALLAIASSPSDAHVFTVNDFAGLAQILQQLTFQSCVKVLSINPNHGPQAGGNAVLITGTGFELANGTIYVRFGSTVVKAVPGDDNTIGVIVPAGAAGPVSVEISFDGSEYSSGSNVTYTYDGVGCGPNNCAPNGQCLAGKCLCNSGWGGPYCTQQECSPSCVYGTCQGGQCVCEEGYQGNACQYPIILCCHYCGFTSVQWSAECDAYRPGGPSNSGCTGYSDRKLVKFWVQGPLLSFSCFCVTLFQDLFRKETAPIRCSAFFRETHGSIQGTRVQKVAFLFLTSRKIKAMHFKLWLLQL